MNLLKSVTNLQLDRSPTLQGPAPAAPPLLPPPAAHPELTASEREALEGAVSPEFLSDQGWTEGRSGEIRNDKGRRLFEQGYTRAIRKVLAR